MSAQNDMKEVFLDMQRINLQKVMQATEWVNYDANRYGRVTKNTKAMLRKALRVFLPLKQVKLLEEDFYNHI